MNHEELRQDELRRERAPDVAEVLRLTEENKKLRQAARLIALDVLSTIADARFELPDSVIKQVEERFGVE